MLLCAGNGSNVQRQNIFVYDDNIIRIGCQEFMLERGQQGAVFFNGIYLSGYTRQGQCQRTESGADLYHNIICGNTGPGNDFICSASIRQKILTHLFFGAQVPGFHECGWICHEKDQGSRVRG